MVLAIILSHGRYSLEQRAVPDVNVPYNIRLILYTNPGKNLSADEVDYILRQLLETRDTFHFTFKPEILDIDKPPYIPFELKSPPYIKRIKRTTPYPNDKREQEMNQTYKPRGKFKIYEPGVTTPNIELEIMPDIGNKNRSIFGDPKIVLQTEDGSIDGLLPKILNMSRLKDSIGIFLQKLSCFYEKIFPGKVINVIQLSCRSDAKIEFQSTDELADAFSNFSMDEYNEDVIDYRPRLEGFKVQNKSENLYKSPDFEFIYKNPPYIIKKSEEIDIPNPSACSPKSGGRKLYKNKILYNKIYSKKKKYNKIYKSTRKNRYRKSKNRSRKYSRK